MIGWRFDPYSALIGAALMLVLFGAGYLLRDPFLRGWQEVGATARRWVGRATAGIEDRYRGAVVAWAQRTHALAGLGPLESLFLSPRLLSPPPNPNPEAEEVLEGGPLPLGMALRGHRRLLILGPLGSGRSALMAYLALIHARREAGSALGLAAERIPLYLHLAEVDGSLLESDGEGKSSLDLARLALRAVGGPPAGARALQRHLMGGTALVLVDGWDEQDRPRQERAATWLAGLADALPGNLWLVAAGTRGYAPLTDAGFVPLRLERWGHSEVEAFLERCASLLPPPQEGAAVQEPLLGPEAGDRKRALEEAPTLLELALRTWLILTVGEAPPTRGALFMAVLERLLSPSDEEAWLLAAVWAALGELALVAQQEGRPAFTRREIETALEAALSAQEVQVPRVMARVLPALTAPGGPLVLRGSDRYAFAHPLWQACLVAHQVAEAASVDLTEHLDDPRWLPLLDFYAEVGPMERVVEAWLSGPDDLWRNRLCTAARWVALAPSDAPWRNGVMALLARSFLEPSLPPGVRERLGEALARTGDPGVPLFLHQALRHSQEMVRATAAWAMGLLGQRANLSALAEALSDPEGEVRVAAALALGHVGTPAAIRLLAEVLVQGEEMLRVEAARGLAYAGEAGWEVLREAMVEEDLLTRRAAAYGLGEVQEPWARELLERTAREDEQWIVRSAADAVLAGMKAARVSPVAPPPMVSEMAWLISWAAERGEAVGVGQAAFGPLEQALHQGDRAIRQAAAWTLGLVGRPEHASALRQAMGDPNPEVAQIASWALEEVARRHDILVQ